MCSTGQHEHNEQNRPPVGGLVRALEGDVREPGAHARRYPKFASRSPHLGRDTDATCVIRLEDVRACSTGRSCTVRSSSRARRL